MGAAFMEAGSVAAAFTAAAAFMAAVAADTIASRPRWMADRRLV
jgi:hypothetical protein